MRRDIYDQMFWDHPPVHSVNLFSLYTTYIKLSESDGGLIFFDDPANLVIARDGLYLFHKFWYVYCYLSVAFSHPPLLWSIRPSCSLC